MKSNILCVADELKNSIEDTSFIGSRNAGEAIRLKCDELFKNNNTITLDFISVEEVTQGFVDEVVGIYTRAYGIGFIKDKIKLINANQSIKDTFNFVVNYSKKDSK